MEGKLAWVHSATKYALITVHARRGIEAMNAAGVLPNFSGIVCRDAWAHYDSYPEITYALVRSHYAELQAVTDLVADGPWCWATRAVDALREMKVLVNQGREVGENDEVADPGVLAEQVRRYCAATVIGARDTAARPSKLMKEDHALANRLINRQDDYLRFTTDPRVPFDDNASERRSG